MYLLICWFILFKYAEVEEPRSESVMFAGELLSICNAVHYFYIDCILVLDAVAFIFYFYFFLLYS